MTAIKLGRVRRPGLAPDHEPCGSTRVALIAGLVTSHKLCRANLKASP
jgi:hypothetical protein